MFRKIICIMALLLIIGCDFQKPSDNYSIQKIDKDICMINTKTGDVSIIDDGYVIQLPKITLNNNKIVSFDSSILNTLQVDFKAKMVNYEVSYIMHIGPFIEVIQKDNGKSEVKEKDFEWFVSSLKENKYDRITIDFLDKDGFTVYEHEIKIQDFDIRVVNDDGEVSQLRYKSKIHINPIQFQSVENVTYSYSISALKKYLTSKS